MERAVGANYTENSSRKLYYKGLEWVDFIFDWKESEILYSKRGERFFNWVPAGKIRLCAALH